MKPRLPSEIEAFLPDDILFLISTYLEHLRKPKQKPASPYLEKELTKLQSYDLCGKNEMYLKDLDDFIL
jgi:hypothetical protein